MKHLFFLSPLLLLVVLHTSPSSSEPLYTICEDTISYATNSTFNTNLKLLFSSLSSNASLNKGFYNSTIGQAPNEAYGLTLCRGDTSPKTCFDCIDTASKELLSNCPNKSAITWYDNCLLRYSDKRFFTSTVGKIVPMPNDRNISGDKVQFDTSLSQLMDDISQKAAYEPRNNWFATGEVKLSDATTIYGLVQCTRDISRLECSICLRESVSFFPTYFDGKSGGRFLQYVCTIRFETFRFFGPSKIAIGANSPSPVVNTSGFFNNGTAKRSGNKSKFLGIIIPIISVAVILFVIILLLRKRGLQRKKKTSFSVIDGLEESGQPFLYSFEIIRSATNDFSDENKLGEGGFGSVYKGRLSDGQEIAVKRLSINSVQGVEQFRNEVSLVAKLQHRNLVRLFGCCVEGREKLLIYEYIPNKSLDTFLFDPNKRGSLDWEHRHKIIRGIARGLLYLHEDSRLRIIHRDLKASNVLLDAEMNAKISDFGMAKMVGVGQTQGNTDRIAGTYGYMSPEYAMQGRFSVKSDAFSFGVLLLEIVTGEKNALFYQSGRGGDLPSYVWNAWNAGTVFKIIDPTIIEHCSKNEVMTCVHIGLLCVQEDANARPSMSSVALMFNSYSLSLPAPSPPAFFIGSKHERGPQVINNSSSTNLLSPSPGQLSTASLNDVSITELEPR